MKKSFFLIMFLCAAIMGIGQTITINTADFDVSKPYGQGSSISLPMTTSGCFNIGNKFNLVLSDASGSFSGTTTLIGNFNGFFTTYVNGSIPVNMAASTNYKLRVEATNPVYVGSQSPFFEIRAVSKSVSSIVTTSVPRTLADQIFFGWCSTQPNNALLSLNNQSSSSAIVTGILKNEKTGTSTNIALSSNVFSVTLPTPTYYTFTVRADSSGILSTKSYFLINTPNVLGIANNGQQKPCLPDSVYFQIPIDPTSGGIGNNFPGMLYRIDWGDGTTSYKKQCDLLASNGSISHLYNQTSCNIPNGAFFVTPSLIYPYFPTGSATPGNCDGGNVSSNSSVFLKPKADFSSKANACVNTNVTFTNNSDPGMSKSQNGNSCVSAAYYTWFVNGTVVYTSSAPEYNPPLNYKFTAPGTYNIKLSIDNNSCGIIDTTKTICIESATDPQFAISNTSVCAPANIITTNTTQPNNCGLPTYNWSVLDSLGNLTVPTNYYSISPNISFATPTITINNGGKYQIQLCATNSCGIKCLNQTVTISGKPLVSLPSAKSYCNNGKTIDFGTDINHKPSYDIQYGNTPTYQWTVSGGTSSVGNGTSLTSQYPQITFNDLATYTVTLVYSNNCGSSQTATQTITFAPPTTFTASPPSATICSNTSTNITLSSPSSGVQYSWTVAALPATISGASSQSNQLVKSIQQKLINTGNVDAVATYTITTAGCSGQSQTVNITVNPSPTVAYAGIDQKLCSQTSTKLSATATTVGTGLWTRIFGSSGTLTDPTNAATTVTGLLAPDSIGFVWTISSTGNSCPGSSDTMTIVNSVLAVGGSTGPNTIVCGTSNGGIITLTGQVGNIIRWEKSIDNGNNWVAIANTTSTLTYSNILQTTQFRAVLQSGICPVVTSTITTISVAGATGNSNAGTDQFFCNQTSTQLNAIAPSSGSTGTWSQVAGSAATITDKTLYNTTVTGLSIGTFKFVWALSNGVCPPSNDTVSIINYPPLTNTITGNTQTICLGQTVTIVGQNPTGGNGIYIYQWQQSADSISWVNITGETTANITYNPTTTGFVRRLVTSSTCSAVSNAATIIVQPSVSNNTILKDTTICIGSSVNTLTGSAPNGGNGSYTYQWENSVDGGSTWITISGATAINYLPPAPTISTKYRRRVSSNVCTGLQSNNSNIVTITVNSDAKAQYTYTKDIDCAIFNLTSTIQNVTNSGNGSYLWYANNVLIGNGTIMPNYSITNPFDSVIIKLKALSQYGCKNDSLQHKFYTVPKPVTAFNVSDTVGCGPLSISVANKTPNANLFSFKWDFGNGVTSTIANPSPIILQPNPTHLDTIYTITLSAFTPCDTIKTTQKVRVKSKPQALFTPDKSVGCSPFTTTFNNTSKGNNMNFIWSFGDGQTLVSSNSSAVQHTYNTGKQDTFKVKLIAINECGNDTLIYSIVVSPNKIKLDFAVNGNEAYSCLPSTVHFINNTSGATAFSWNFGDGNFLNTTKNIDTVAHTYTTAGSFVVRLSATNGCSDTTDYEAIKVFTSPIAKFTANPLSACLGDSIHFANQTDTATGYTWRYGDGNSSSLTNPVYTYKTAGNFAVKLIAVRQYNSIVCMDSAATTISIVAKLVGAFKVSDSVSNCVPFNVVFTNLSVPSALTTWDFNDGKKDTGNLVQHNFITTGTYNVKMNAVNAGGCNYEAFKTIVVKGPSGTWVYDNGLICGNKQVRFQANVLNTDSLHFNFGDGSFLTTTNTIVYHTYLQSGNYLPSVDLLAGTACHVMLQGNDTIKIDNIKGGFTINQQKICGTTTVTFSDTSRAFFGIQKWQWNFGDGSALSNIQSPQHSYSVTNTWPVQLIVFGKSGCTDTVNQQVFVSVNTKPKASIQAVSFGCTNQGVTYTANITSVDSVLLKLWKFYDGSNAIGTMVSKLYPSAGTYTTNFIVGTTNGCYDTAYNTINIYQSPTVIATNDLSICKGQSTQLNATGSNNYSWSPTNNLSCTTCSNPIATPSITTPYVVSTTSNLGCTATDTVVITVAQPFKISVSANDSICIGQSTKLSASGAYKYSWLPATALSDATAQSPIANPIVTTTYQVTGTDQYNCFTDVATVTIGVGDYPVLNLGQDQVLAAGTLFTFNPKFTNGPIKDWRWNPVTDLSCTTCANPIATAKNDICYTATATNNYGCAGSDTMCIKVFCQSTQVFIPNAFIPGTGSGINDVLMVRGKGIKLVKSFRIFNRWGQVVFERANFAPNDRQYGWDGLIQGKTANSDVYVYTCEVVCENDVAFVYKGNVAILK